MRELKFRVWDKFSKSYRYISGVKDFEYYSYPNGHPEENTFPELEQYTGLKDKNGVEIYEGDCLGHIDNVVEFSFGCFNTNGDRPLTHQGELEIISNIHEAIK